MTTDKRAAKILQDAPAAHAAIVDVVLALQNGDPDKLQAAAKTLEAFGCYARRTKLEARPWPRRNDRGRWAIPDGRTYPSSSLARAAMGG